MDIPARWQGLLVPASRLNSWSAHSGDSLSIGLPEIDRQLGGGLPRGSLMELRGEISSGRFAFALAALARATQSGENAALVDLEDNLDPRRAAASGVDLSRLLWVRPRGFKAAAASAEIILQAGFPLVVLELGLSCPNNRVPESVWLRLAQNARDQNAGLLVSTPGSTGMTAAGAVVALRRPQPQWRGNSPQSKLLEGLSTDVILKKRRGGATGAAALSLSWNGTAMP